MSPGGLTDLAAILADLAVSVRPERYVVVGPPDTGRIETMALDRVAALVGERQGWTAVVTVETAVAEGWPTTPAFAWLTLEVHTSLEAVGLTAAVARALTDEGISANVIAAYHHDHLLVPADRADDAVTAVEALRAVPAVPARPVDGPSRPG